MLHAEGTELDPLVLQLMQALRQAYPSVAFAATVTQAGEYRLLAQRGGRFAEQVFLPAVLERPDAVDVLARYGHVLVVSVGK